MLFNRALFSVLIVNWVFLTVQSVHAQNIVISSPASSITVFEGDDYASSELRNPWDGNERRDFGWEENLVGSGPNGIRSERGKISSEFSSVNGHFYPLFQGYTNSIFAEGLDGDRSLPRFGRKHPIDSSRYSYLSYRLNLSSRSVGSISWSNDTQSSLIGGGWPNQRAAYFDGYYTNTKGISRLGYYTYLFDLSSLNSTFGGGLFDGTWSGRIISLRIEPSSSSGKGTKLDVDWIRLTDPRSAPMLNLQWSKSTIPQGFALVVGYSSAQSELSDFTPVLQDAKVDPGQFQFPLSALPPGDYYFYVALVSDLDSKQFLSISRPTPVIRVLPAPEVVINSPTQLSGQDYATAVLADPWDMSNAEDVANLDTSIWPQLWRQFSEFSFIGGVFSALTDPPLTSIQQTDAQVHLKVSSQTPIDTSKYRYLTYRVQVDEANHPSISEKASDGWVMRPVAWNANHGTEPGAFLPAGHLLYEGDHSYTYDLWDESRETLDLGSSWKTNPWLYNLRLDPLEVSKRTRFFLDDVKLTAEPRPDRNGNFPISFTLNGSGEYAVKIWASPSGVKSISPSTDLLIANLANITSGSHQFIWNMSKLPEQSRWYIKVEVLAPGTGRRVFASQVEVVAGQFLDLIPPAAPERTQTLSPIQPTLPGGPKEIGILARSRLSRRKLREGDFISFHTEVRVRAGDRPRKITAQIRSSRKTYTVTLRPLGKRKYFGSWRALRTAKGSRSVFSVQLTALTSKGNRDSNSLGQIEVRRR